MRNRMLALIGTAAAASALFGCGGDSQVEATSKNLSSLHVAVAQKFPAKSITQHRLITDELIKAGTMPKEFVKDGKGQNAWGGGVHVWVFPEAAWGAGTPPTINYVFEAVPQKECAQLVETLSRRSEMKIFRMNLEPSKKVYTAFPVSKDDGCTAEMNNVGYTVFAK